MAQECFMCGEQVRGLTTRGINKQGRRTVELNDKIKAAIKKVEEQGPLSEGGDSGPMVASLNELAAAGDSFAAFWHGAVHGDVPLASESRVIKKEWNDWGQEARRMVRLLELPPEQLKQIIEQSA